MNTKVTGIRATTSSTVCMVRISITAVTTPITTSATTANNEVLEYDPEYEVSKDILVEFFEPISG